ncbi:MAG: hypothetical protein H0U00_03380 [Actinobacteria bacterium]|nr:hypothetical protein [Actinomycetota bacterium]
MATRELIKLKPDECLLERRAAGESLRALALDYCVSHEALRRYLLRPEVKHQVEEIRNERERVVLEAQPSRKSRRARDTGTQAARRPRVKPVPKPERKPEYEFVVERSKDGRSASYGYRLIGEPQRRRQNPGRLLLGLRW